MFVDFISSSVNTNALFDEKQRTVWTTYFREIAGSSPAMREFWRKNRHWYERLSRRFWIVRAPTGVRRDEE